uniref:Uncharacterized protein n=2 Tax=Oryza rufipogon TaxID=4529 RepID=A0A0E0PY61_ORYRU
MGSGRRRRSAILCRHRSTSKVAITVHPSPTHRRYSWSPPLALPPAISGDKTNIVGCARAWRTFLLLGATSDSPPFAADVDVKPAGRAGDLEPPLSRFPRRCPRKSISGRSSSLS